MNKPTPEHWLQHLEGIHPTAIELGLERVSAVARKLELLPVAVPVVTVAGTNGKGSAVAFLEALLTERGRVTGTFTSPHLLRFNERIRVAAAEVSDAEIVTAFDAIEGAREGIKLTYFEFATLAALLVFRVRRPDVVILEVGLGGRLDSVNIVDATVAVITGIDLDHQGWLGHTRAEIALEKAGILRRGKPLVIADPEPPAELLACAVSTGAAPVLALGRDFSVADSGAEWQGTLLGADRRPRRLPPQARGPLLPANICAALQAALLLGENFTDAEMGRALAAATPRGRRELLCVDGREYLLDVAHNPAAVDVLLDFMNVTRCKGRTIALFSAMADKDLRAMIGAATGAFDAWYLADQPGNDRAAAATELAVLLRAEGQHRISVSENLPLALSRAQRDMVEGDRLVVFGSFYTVAAVLPLLDGGRRGGESGADT